MLNEKQKIVHVLDELLNYALYNHPQKVTIKIEELAGQVQITVEEINVQLSARECQAAERFLNTPRHNEMQEYYSGLAGEETLSPRNLRIVGLMVDGGRLESCESGTQLSIWWKPE
ncbi:MAG: hypothetical protein U9Q70_04145 [Chloroflexota bacterium]|nr:hypothetical protein [Chloroflexota bacterium]